MTGPFATRATGGGGLIDAIEVDKALRLLTADDQVFELRGITSPGARSKICRGDNIPDAIDSARDLADSRGVYWTLNPCRLDLDKAASNPDILERRWLLVDVDAIRPADVNATDTEKEAAGDLAWLVFEHLTELGWPHPLIVDSGNGWHLLYRIDLPNDKLSQATIRSALIALADRFDTTQAKVDRSVHNASRISKLPGTWVRKGPHSDERPHRLSRIALAPAGEIGVVTFEQLQAISAKPAVQPMNVASPFATTATNTRPDLDHYLAKAVELEIARVAMATAGNRNNALNRAAFSLGTMAAWPEMIESTVRGELYAIGIRVGLDDREVILTIASGWESGVKSPRPRPVQTSAPGMNGFHAGVIPGTKLTIKLRDVKPEKVDWFYENRIAPGFITIFAGRTGQGKSFVACDIVARLSFGFQLPFSGIDQLPMGTLFVSEDSVPIVLAPRLISLGADVDAISFMTWEAMTSYTLSNVDMLEQAYIECGRPRLIVIDPPANFLGGVDANSYGEVREALKPLCFWLEKYRVACILITHINKQVGKGLEAVERIIGSVGWGNTARITMAFVKDPDDESRYLFGSTKNNLGPLADTLAYRIGSTPDGASLEWLGKSDTTMENAMNQVKRKTRGICAVEWLTDRFREKFEWESEELKKTAIESGISKNALWSAEAMALPIVKRPRTDAAGDKSWWWTASPGWPPLVPDPDPTV